VNGPVEPWPAVEAFLAFVLREEPTTRSDWPELARLLDGLAVARHACPAPEWPEARNEAPRADDASLRSVLGLRFPAFGYYHVVVPLVDGDLAMEQEPRLGDAIDDLLDIAHDLQQALWYRRHRDTAVAAALLAWSFDAHWGQHLRHLQGYVHHRLRE